MSVNDRAKEVTAAFEQGRLDRRQAIKSLLSLGFTAPAAYTALGLVSDSITTAAAQDLSRDQLNKQIEMLTRLISSPDVMKVVQAPPGDRIEAARRLLEVISRPENIKSAGMDPKMLRMSLRVFENNVKTETIFTLANSRMVGTERLTKERVSSQPPAPITDDELNRAFNPTVVKVRPAGGVCISYGKDLCVSGGIP